MNRFKRSQSVHQKIIIIGAGAAGIAAATRLLANGFNDLIILEAENRIGGRIHTIRCDGGVIELGAQWCHGEVDNVVYQLVKDLNVLSSTQTFNDNQFYSSDGRVLNKRLTDKIVKIVEQIFEDNDAEIKVKTYGEYFITKYNAKIKEEFGDDREAAYIADYLKEWFHKFLNSLNGTINWHEISPKEHYQKCEGDQLLNWQDKGFHTIIDILMKKFPDTTKQSPIDDKIFLNKEVTRIIWDDNIINENGVTVECADGSSYNGDHVIVTVSLGVLKKFYRNFIPELPKNKQLAIEHFGFGVVGKILLKFPEQWWPTNSQGFSLVWNDNDRKQIVNEFPHGPVKHGRSWLEDVFGFYAIDSHPRFLLGWIVGEMMVEIERLSDDLVQDGCMYLLRKVAGRSCKIPEPDAIFRSKWTTDPHFLGCYSFVGLATEQAQVTNDDLAQPLVSSSSKQTVLFAGEATHSRYFSTVHGAIESGFREADRIVNIYKSDRIMHRKVAIIGAGMAGLGAAHQLTTLGCDDFIIVEAQDQAGGRCNTIVWDNHIFELGAQFIHGQHNPLFDYANKHELVAEKRTEEGLGIYVRDDGQIIDEALVETVDFQVGRILLECEEFVTSTDYPASISEYLDSRFEQYLNESGDRTDIEQIKRELYDWHVRFQIIDNSCIDLRQLSAKNWGRYVCLDDEAHVNLKCGYGPLVQRLINDLPANSLLLSKPICEIKCDDNCDESVELICQDGTVIYCDHVIITTSLGVLKSDTIKITPPLPCDLINTIKNMGFYGIGKIFLVFEHRWWDVDGFQLIWSKDAQLDDEIKWTRHIQGFDSVYNEPNILLGWVGGPGVVEMETLNVDDVGRHCMKIIRRFVRDRKIPEPINVIRSNWMSNPWIRGAYSHITPQCDDSNTDIEQLSQPIYMGGKLRMLLAGEAVHPSHYSTTHGAYESGQKQARLLYESLSSSKVHAQENTCDNGLINNSIGKFYRTNRRLLSN